MKNGIMICGLNGAGKSTIGRKLSKRLNYKFIDVEDYYFQKNDTNYKYDSAISKDEVISLILEDIKKCENFVMVSCTGDFGKKIEDYFTQVVVLDVPKEERLKRVRNRSFEKFGNRILKGGDLYEREEKFFNDVENKTDERLNTCLKKQKCPVIHVDGTRQVIEIVDELINKLL